MTYRLSGAGPGALAPTGGGGRLQPRPEPPLAAPAAGPHPEGQELAVMEDRQRIALDLHDLVVQRLFAAGLALKSTADLAADPEIARRIDHVIDELDGTIVDIRTTIFALGQRYRSAAGDLRSQILDLVRDAARTLGHHPRVRFYGPVATAVPDAVAEHLLAVLREALSNVARHAHATETTVCLSVAGTLELEVTDNGVGAAGSAPNSGLRNMASRADSLGGATEVSSPGSGGTRVKWWVPAQEIRAGTGPSGRPAG